MKKRKRKGGGKRGKLPKREKVKIFLIVRCICMVSSLVSLRY